MQERFCDRCGKRLGKLWHEAVLVKVKQELESQTHVETARWELCSSCAEKVELTATNFFTPKRRVK
jgi:hypothetical protein